jgi:hypothetical protein
MPDEIIIQIRRPEELFAVDPLAPLHDPASARIQPGMEELLAEILARPRVRRAPQLVVELPADHIDDATADRLTAAVSRWCVQRMERAERETRVIWRQGMRSLRSGALLFLIGLALSSDFIAPDVPEFLQEVLGNGVFVVIAWVGLWYPLDLLFFARQPLRREMRVLEKMTHLPIAVRPNAVAGLPPSAQ